MSDLVKNNEMSFGDYLKLGKFRLCLLVLFTGLIGYCLGPVEFEPTKIVCFLLGTLLTAMGANGLNQWWERQRDGQMVRTRNRPIPSGKISPAKALLVTSLWSTLGIVLLFFSVNPLTAYLAFATLVSYLIIYTPLKTFSSVAILAGAIPGAIPPVMGWTAATNSLGKEAIILFCLMFLWQIPHFMALASIYQRDYDKGGYNLLPDNPEYEKVTRSIIVVFCLALLGTSVLVPAIGLGTILFFSGALILGGVMLYLALKFYQCYSVENARLVFRASIIYIPILMTLLVLDERLISHL